MSDLAKMMKEQREKQQKQGNGKPKEEPKRDHPEITITKDNITVREFYEGKERFTTYDTIENCMICNKKRLCSGQTASCPVCDKVLSESEYEKRFPSKKEAPKQPIQKKPMPPASNFDLLLKKYSTRLNISQDALKTRYDKMKEVKGLLSEEGRFLLIEKDLEREKQPKLIEFPESLKPFKERFLKIIESTDLSLKEVLQKILDKMTELEGKIETEGAITLVERELGLREEVTDAKTEEIVEEIVQEAPKENEKVIPVNQEVTTFVIEEHPKQEKKVPTMTKKEKETALKVAEISNTEIVKKEPQTEALMPHKLPTLKEIDQYIQRYNYVKQKIVNDTDFINISGKRFMCKSGWRKFVNAFGLSIVLVSKRTYEAFNDKHCEVIVRAIAPSGQFVEGLGIKSWSELSKKTIHNLEATAWTKAVNRAVSDLVAFGEVSAEEMIDKGNEHIEYVEE